MNDALGDRMKMYESAEAGRRLMPLLPILARIDGRSFHSFTRGMDRPFDHRFQAAMSDTVLGLLKETNANIGYTQSDEITLAWHTDNPKEEVWFGGRVSKMVSQLAAHATLLFYRACQDLLPEYLDRNPTFDARVWNVPNLTEAANVFVWRELDAVKNSISMAAQHYYSHGELFGKTGAQKQEMLFQKGVNWNDYEPMFKRGEYIRKHKVHRKFTPDEIERLPPKHAARTNPDLTVERTTYRILDLAPLTKIINREHVLFHGAAPVVEVS